VYATGPRLRPKLRLASLVTGEKYIDRAPHGTAETLRLHSINHAWKDTLPQF